MMQVVEAPVLGQSPWLTPTFLLAVVIQLIILVAWLVRMEFKTNANANRQSDYEEAVKEKFGEVAAAVKKDMDTVNTDVRADRADTREWKKEFYKHATDTKVHHNEEMFREFRSGIDRRFSGVEGSLLDISRKLDHLAERE